MALSDKIFLVGMPGAGKSSLGKLLAEQLLTKFIDLDAEIEKVEQVTIRDIFEVKGEAYFRIIESELLHSLTHTHSKFIMATGGGTPCHHNGMNFILDNGSAIYLSISLLQLAKRISNVRDKNVRPKISSTTDIKEQMDALLMERHLVYERASFTIEVDFKESDQLLNECLSL